MLVRILASLATKAKRQLSLVEADEGADSWLLTMALAQVSGVLVSFGKTRVVGIRGVPRTPKPCISS